MTFNDPPPGEPAQINRLRGAVYPSFAMLAGMQLDLFTPLKDGPMTLEALAEALGVGPAKLSPLLYLLVEAELLTVSDGRFANAPEADGYLVRGRAAYVGGAHELLSDLWRAALETAESIRSGLPRAKHDFAAMSEAELGGFIRGLHPGALATGRHLAKTLNLSQCRHLLDVGGGSGGLAIGACETCPALRATVADLPSIAPITERFIAEAEIGDRVRVITTDISAEPVAGAYDVAILRNLIQVLSAADARRVLANVARSLEPGGAIHIVGHVLDDTRLSPPAAVSINMVFVNLYDDGQAYTEAEHRQWLAEAGFRDFERSLLADGHGLVSARR